MSASRALRASSGAGEPAQEDDLASDTHGQRRDSPRGDAYLAYFFGAPVGWSDAAFPDVNITDFHVQFRLYPFIQFDGTLALHEIGVTFLGDLHTDVITSHVEQLIRDGIESA